MSFFRKTGSTTPAPSPWTVQPNAPASPVSWASEADQEKPQPPWKQWLRLGKWAQQSK